MNQKYRSHKVCTSTAATCNFSMMLKTYCFHHKTEEEEHKQKRQQTEVTTSSQHLDHNNMDPHCLVRLNWKITNDLVVIREGLQADRELNLNTTPFPLTDHLDILRNPVSKSE